VNRDTAVVFGGSKGIGRAIAKVLEELGKKVYVAARHRPTEGLDGSTSFLAVDIRDYRQVADVLSHAASAGRLSSVVNSAGVGFFSPLGHDYTAAWKLILETNVLGVANICSTLLDKQLIVDDLIHISSLAAHRVSRTPGNAMYSASKSASEMLVQHFRSLARAREWRTRVTMVTPGFVERTGFADHFFDYSKADVQPLYVPGQNLSPQHIADVVRYVVSRPPEMDIGDVVIRPPSQLD
jgi:NADP+-dependent farnesol dehydrogenase